MDRAWMYDIKRHSDSFMSGVSKFVEAAKEHAHSKRTKQIPCLCFDCKNNIVWENTDVIKTHLIQHSFIVDYKVWIHHGEAQLTGNTCATMSMRKCMMLMKMMMRIPVIMV